MSKQLAVLRTTPIEIKLSENVKGVEAVPSRVQLMKECTFFHKKYGKVEVTRQMFSEMIANFDKKVRRIDPFIDYSHESDKDAAGWILSLELAENDQGKAELWANVDWTSDGALTLSDKKYRYLSADFDPNYEDNETPGVKHGHVLLGAGLTNRPVIKGMNPITTIQLSEFNQEYDMDEETQKKLEQLQKLMTDLGVNSVEEAMAKIAELQGQNATLNEEKQLAEKTEKTNKLFSEGKITKAQVDIAIKLPKESFESFIQLAEMNEGIKKDEHGNGGTEVPKKANDNKDPQDQVIALAEVRAAKDKIGIADAISIVLSENAELKKAYYADTSTEIELEDE